MQMPMPDWLTFLAMVVGALILGASPLGWPLKWAETFYHELSHGLVCKLTGGEIVRISLNFNGAGSSSTRGGWRIPILLAGYAGAAFWGGTLWIGGWILAEQGISLWLQLEIVVLIMAFLLWARDLGTWLILSLIAAVYTAVVMLPYQPVLPMIMQFIGIYVMLNAVRTPLYLLDGEHVGDGAALADIFMIIPECVWVLLWFAFAMAVLGLCFWLSLQPVPAIPL